MSNTVTGVVNHIGETTQVTDTFAKRDFVITVQDGNYENLNAFQLVQAKCEIGDNFTEGQEVTVSYNIRSNESNGRYFTNLTAWKIEGTQSAQPVQQSKPIQAPVAPQTVAPADVDNLPF